MATTKTTICNKAVNKFGGKLIANIDSDTTQEAQWCRALWDDVLDEVLTEYEWSFAYAHKQVAKDPTDPDVEYSYRYAMPSDPYCLQVRGIYSTYTTVPYKIYGRYIHTNHESPIELIYTKRITDVTELSPKFINALATLLAARVSGSMKDRDTAKELEVQYLTVDLPKAIWEDAREQPTNETPPTRWVDNR